MRAARRGVCVLTFECSTHGYGQVSVARARAIAGAGKGVGYSGMQAGTALITHRGRHGGMSHARVFEHSHPLVYTTCVCGVYGRVVTCFVVLLMVNNPD